MLTDAKSFLIAMKQKSTSVIMTTGLDLLYKVSVPYTKNLLQGPCYFPLCFLQTHFIQFGELWGGGEGLGGISTTGGFTCVAGKSSKDRTVEGSSGCSCGGGGGWVGSSLHTELSPVKESSCCKTLLTPTLNKGKSLFTEYMVLISFRPYWIKIRAFYDLWAFSITTYSDPEIFLPP